MKREGTLARSLKVEDDAGRPRWVNEVAVVVLVSDLKEKGVSL